MDPTTLIIAGAGLKAYSQWQGSQIQARAMRQQAKLKKAQAQEMLERMAIQEGRLKEQGEAFKSQQTAEYASSGVQVGTGATLMAMEDTNMKIAQQTEDMKRDTKFRVNQIMLGAKYDQQYASETETAGQMAAAGSLLEGGASLYKTK